MNINSGDKVIFKSPLSDHDEGVFRGWQDGKAVLWCDTMHVLVDKDKIVRIVRS